MKQKTIIVAYGTANIGKSLTLSSLGKQLVSAGATTTNPLSKKEYHAYFKYLDIKIGIQTYGDLKHLVEDGLKACIRKECSIIAIAAKGHGTTVDVIKELADANDYRVVWTKPYGVWDGSINTIDIKDFSASHLKLMIDTIISGSL